jgi:hypothetical protein
MKTDTALMKNSIGVPQKFKSGITKIKIELP